MKRFIFAVVAAAAAIAVPVWAHHSFAMFDNEKELTLEGIIKEVQWSVEGGSPNSLSRAGWKRTSIKPGDKATLVIHPLKNGSPGGSLMRITINGQLIGTPRGGN